MRAVVIIRPTAPAPPGAGVPLAQAVAGWRARHRDRMELFEFFAGARGGLVILNVSDEEALHRVMMEFPLVDRSDVEVRPLLDGDVALGMWREAADAAVADTVSDVTD